MNNQRRTIGLGSSSNDLHFVLNPSRTKTVISKEYIIMPMYIQPKSAICTNNCPEGYPPLAGNSDDWTLLNLFTGSGAPDAVFSNGDKTMVTVGPKNESSLISNLNSLGWNTTEAVTMTMTQLSHEYKENSKNRCCYDRVEISGTMTWSELRGTVTYNSGTPFTVYKNMVPDPPSDPDSDTVPEPYKTISYTPYVYIRQNTNTNNLMYNTAYYIVETTSSYPPATYYVDLKNDSSGNTYLTRGSKKGFYFKNGNANGNIRESDPVEMWFADTYADFRGSGTCDNMKDHVQFQKGGSKQMLKIRQGSTSTHDNIVKLGAGKYCIGQKDAFNGKYLAYCEESGRYETQKWLGTSRSIYLFTFHKL